jgi:hypothetical protein
VLAHTIGDALSDPSTTIVYILDGYFIESKVSITIADALIGHGQRCKKWTIKTMLTRIWFALKIYYFLSEPIWFRLNTL